MDNDGAVVEEVALRTTVRTRLRLNNTAKRSLWSLRQQQREFHNTGVETGLFARNNGEPIPSNYTAHTSVLSAVRKDKTNRWARSRLASVLDIPLGCEPWRNPDRSIRHSVRTAPTEVPFASCLISHYVAGEGSTRPHGGAC